ncbi:M15 family metallopeptidase [Galbibacter pacificus]|uniref:M15 family metallopeptidase n=1 Tax=Galbibacter pacificus TaxID=2996052 RepID=A0ABT6FLZ6_9FLAO|nr:M15 family metallopeptidase [Galbibacter pacificus]MDG3580799.1 M15 family metallopeptidase [Galbibacter pacificus]MDG3584277.1 M15 family metallopeptidase [Galbibacter pacificus]
MKRILIIVFTIIYGTITGQTYSDNILIGKGEPELFGEGIGLQKDAYTAFLKMKKAAGKERVDIKAVSGYRSFNRQKSIWERKYKAYTNAGLLPEEAIEKIVEYSTIPGTSRHHWGTDVDIIDSAVPAEGDVLDADKFHGNGPFCKLKEWLDAHANDFGFYLVYTDDPKRKGFKYEPWHYSYKAISKPMLVAYKKLDIIAILRENKLLGSEYLTPDFMNTYIEDNIMDINPELKD